MSNESRLAQLQHYAPEQRVRDQTYAEVPLAELFEPWVLVVDATNHLT